MLRIHRTPRAVRERTEGPGLARVRMEEIHHASVRLAIRSLPGDPVAWLNGTRRASGFA
jgi:hypothetical protein